MSKDLLDQDYKHTYIIPGEVVRAAEQRMADTFASYGGDPDQVSFVRAAAYVEVAKFRELLGKLALPCRVQPWTFTPEGGIEVVAIFEKEADLRLAQTESESPAANGVQA